MDKALCKLVDASKHQQAFSFLLTRFRDSFVVFKSSRPILPIYLPAVFALPAITLLNDKHRVATIPTQVDAAHVGRSANRGHKRGSHAAQIQLFVVVRG